MRLVCNVCRHEWCGKCRVAWHEGLTCEQHARSAGEQEADKGFAEYEKGHKVRSPVRSVLGIEHQREKRGCEMYECNIVVDQCRPDSSNQRSCLGAPAPVADWRCWALRATATARLSARCAVELAMVGRLARRHCRARAALCVYCPPAARHALGAACVHAQRGPHLERMPQPAARVRSCG